MSRHDGDDPFIALNLPKAVLAQAEKLLARITTAPTALDCHGEAIMAEGFVLGIETVKALNAASIETLYLTFDHAHTSRVLKLERQG